MLNSILRKVVGVAAVAGGAAVATAGARYVGSKRINAAERLGLALLDARRLEEASDLVNNETEAALAACAAYLINVAHQAAAGITGPPAVDAIGFERKVTDDKSKKDKPEAGGRRAGPAFGSCSRSRSRSHSFKPTNSKRLIPVE